MQACVDREADLRVRMGLILQHRDLGGEGPPLVILHGMLGSSRNWQTVGRELASTNHVKLFG